MKRAIFAVVGVVAAVLLYQAVAPDRPDPERVAVPVPGEREAPDRPTLPPADAFVVTGVAMSGQIQITSPSPGDTLYVDEPFSVSYIQQIQPLTGAVFATMGFSSDAVQWVTAREDGGGGDVVLASNPVQYDEQSQGGTVSGVILKTHTSKYVRIETYSLWGNGEPQNPAPLNVSNALLLTKIASRSVSTEVGELDDDFLDNGELFVFQTDTDAASFLGYFDAPHRRTLGIDGTAPRLLVERKHVAGIFGEGSLVERVSDGSNYIVRKTVGMSTDGATVTLGLEEA